MNGRIERSKENYKGTPAIHDKITTMADYPEWVGDTLMYTTNGLIIVADRYFDASANTFLGGTMTMTIKGKAEPATDLLPDDHFSREARPSCEMGITPFGEMNITLTCQGQDLLQFRPGHTPVPVNVPAISAMALPLRSGL